MDIFLIALPGFLLSAISVLPLAIGIKISIRHLRVGSRSAYLRNLIGSIVAGAVSLQLLWGTLFADNLSSSSTAGLIFIFVPIYSVAAQCIAYVTSSALIKSATTTKKISIFERNALLVPLLIFSVLLFGLLRSSVIGNDLAVAERATNAQTLQQLFEKSRNGTSNKFGIQLFLSQNPNTPPHILVEIAIYDPYLRNHVAQNPRAPLSLLRQLSDDCELTARVQEIVNERLRSDKTIDKAQTNRNNCGA